MKNIYSILAGLLITVNVFAQAPQKMSYQAVIRNSSNALVTSTTVGVKISILQGTVSGAVAYSETQNITSNANGLVSLEIGAGTPITGTFAAINWATGPYFIKTETDPTGGNSYSITSTSQLMSVPYALFSANASVGGFTHYLGESYLGGIIYYLYKGIDGLEHGLIVSLTESGPLAWQNSGTLLNANRTWDGAYNTALMSDSPAASYISTLGSGWYLPSIDELVKLYHNRYETNKALFAGGNTLLLKSDYWSSTEHTATHAYTFYFSIGSSDADAKTYTPRVRGIRAF